MCNLCCLCYEYRVFGYRHLSKPGLFLWKKALKHSKEYFASDCSTQDRVPENGVFHTFNLEKAFSFRGLRPPPPPPPHPTEGHKSPHDPHFPAFGLSFIPISENGFRNETKRARIRSFFLSSSVYILFFSFYIIRFLGNT